MTDKQCDRCGEVSPAEIHTCTPKQEPLAQMKEMLEVQGRDGTWNYDPYSQGMFNGMEFMVALAEGRDPVFRKAPEKWIYTIPPQPDAVINGMPAYEGPLSKSQRLAQPEPEPVAWGIANTRPTEKQPLMMVMLDEPEPSHLVVPLYTAPSQLCCEEYENCTRPCTPRGRWLAHMEDFKYKETEFVLKCKPAWQGLTNEEQLEIMKQFGPGQRGLFADAIEAKLKEKNNAT